MPPRVPSPPRPPPPVTRRPETDYLVGEHVLANAAVVFMCHGDIVIFFRCRRRRDWFLDGYRQRITTGLETHGNLTVWLFLSAGCILVFRGWMWIYISCCCLLLLCYAVTLITFGLRYVLHSMDSQACVGMQGDTSTKGPCVDFSGGKITLSAVQDSDHFRRSPNL